MWAAKLPAGVAEQPGRTQLMVNDRVADVRGTSKSGWIVTERKWGTS